jgi:acyl-CoA reductase-like NAD-dependent aldehyde dehydrogenase
MQSPTLNFTPRGLYIGGRWVSPIEGKSFASINPSNMEKLADVPTAGAADVDAAAQAAKAAFRDWSRVPIKERARCLQLLADAIEENADELALLDAVDSGNAIVGMHDDMIWTADWLRYCAALVTEIKGETFLARGSPSQPHTPTAVWCRSKDQSVQSSLSVLRREGCGTARGRQYRRDQGFRAGTAFKLTPG